MSSILKSKHATTNNGSTTNNKANYQVLEQERNLLKITLDYVVKENEVLKQQLEDMKITVKHNKELLKEYVDNITSKDKVVEKMNGTIEQLTSRMHSLEEYFKQSKNKNSKKETKNIPVPESHSTSSQIISPIPPSVKVTTLPEDKKDNNNSIILTLTATGRNNTNTNTNTNSNTNTSTFNTRNNSEIQSQFSQFTHMMNNTKNFKYDLNKKEDEEKVKEFFFRQNRLIEEMSTLKDDLQFILENKTKSKLKETLENGNVSLNNSFVNLNESSILNKSVISSSASHPIKKKLNLKEKSNMDQNATKFQEFFSSYNPSKNILLFVDSKNSFWELVRRNDINMNNFMNNCENIVSITHGLNIELSNNKFLCMDPDDSPKSKFLNIEIKDRSLNNSELDISKMTDFNISTFIRDIND